MGELLLVIDRPAQIAVRRTRRRGAIVRAKREAIEAVFEHRLDVPIRAGAMREGTLTGGFDPIGAVLFGKSQEAETRSIALLGMRAARENLFDERRRGGP